MNIEIKEKSVDILVELLKTIKSLSVFKKGGIVIFLIGLALYSIEYLNLVESIFFVLALSLLYASLTWFAIIFLVFYKK